MASECGLRVPLWPPVSGSSSGPETVLGEQTSGGEQPLLCDQRGSEQWTHLHPSSELCLSSLKHRFYERRRSSVVLNLPGLEVFPGDLLVSDGAADYLCHPLLLLNPGPVHSAYVHDMPALGQIRR